MSLYRLNGTQASTSDIKDVVGNLGTFGAAGEFCYSLTRYNILIKKQQQTLLEYIRRRNNVDCIYDGESIFLCIQCRSFTLYRV